MSEICPTCGLTTDLCVCETIAREAQKITVSLIKKKFGKAYTVIKGINENEVDTKDLAKKLKNKFACGGTAKDGIVELQGDHRRNVKDVLITLGFPADTVEVKSK
jgi:translation initiation factor 1